MLCAMTPVLRRSLAREVRRPVGCVPQPPGPSHEPVPAKGSGSGAALHHGLGAEAQQAAREGAQLDGLALRVLQTEVRRLQCVPQSSAHPLRGWNRVPAQNLEHTGHQAVDGHTVDVKKPGQHLSTPSRQPSAPASLRPPWQAVYTTTPCNKASAAPLYVGNRATTTPAMQD